MSYQQSKCLTVQIIDQGGERAVCLCSKLLTWKNINVINCYEINCQVNNFKLLLGHTEMIFCLLGERKKKSLSHWCVGDVCSMCIGSSSHYLWSLRYFLSPKITCGSQLTCTTCVLINGKTSKVQEIKQKKTWKALPN